VPSAGSVDSDGDGDIGGDGRTEAPAAAAAAAGKKPALLLPLPLPLLTVLVPPSVSVGDVCKRRSFSLAEVRIRARAAVCAGRASSGRTAAARRSQTFSRGFVCYVCGGTTAGADGAAEHEPPCLRRWEADRKQSVRRAAPSTERAIVARRIFAARAACRASACSDDARHLAWRVLRRCPPRHRAAPRMEHLRPCVRHGPRMPAAGV
jgi:hypothetical protein